MPVNVRDRIIRRNLSENDETPSHWQYTYVYIPFFPLFCRYRLIVHQVFGNIVTFLEFRTNFRPYMVPVWKCCGCVPKYRNDLQTTGSIRNTEIRFIVWPDKIIKFQGGMAVDTNLIMNDANNDEIWEIIDKEDDGIYIIILFRNKRSRI